jgi:SAM-dependent methyltransferase
VRVLAFGSYDLRAHPRVGVLIEGLRQNGDEVRQVVVPLGLDTAARVAMLRNPLRLPLLALRLARSWMLLTVRGRRAVRGWWPDAVLVGYLGHFDVLLARRLFPRLPIALDHLIFAADTAADRGESGSLKQWLLRRLDRAAIGSADLVVFDTAEHAALLPVATAGAAVLAPVGAAPEWFAGDAVTTPVADGVLTVVFYGLFTPLQGTPVIGRALGLLADEPRVRALMIGNGQELAAARAAAAGNPNVTWRSWVDAEQLPELVARHDVCLGVFGTGPKARRVVPNKVFQGAAAGCAVITSDTPPQRAALGDAAVLIPPGDAAGLAATLRELAVDPVRLADLRARARKQADDHFAPRVVVSQLRARLLDLVDPAVLVDPPAPVHRPDATDPGAAVPQSAPLSAVTITPLPPLPPRAWLRYDLVSRIVASLEPGTVLEPGCGQGSFGARLAARARYLGVEPDELAASVATSRISPRGGTVVRGDQRDVPAGSSYDLVCAFEVLEHLEDDAAMLSVWAGFVRPGGHLLLSVPAWPDRFGPMDEHAGHYRRYTPEGLSRLLAASGLDPVSIQVYGWPLGYALEAVRNPIDRRKLAREDAMSMQERTASTGRTFQPPNRALGSAVQLATTPFRYLQRLAPTRGTGLVALARRPAG